VEQPIPLAPRAGVRRTLAPPDRLTWGPIMNALARPLLLLLAMLAAAPAWADASSDERARQLYLNGATLYDEGEYALAVEAFEEAWRLSRRPGLLYNVAQAWQRLGDLDRAIDALNRYRVYATADEADQLRRQGGGPSPRSRVPTLPSRTPTIGRTGRSSSTGRP
jgi:tetratricopeptide (TPR) repeat protein